MLSLDGLTGDNTIYRLLALDSSEPVGFFLRYCAPRYLGLVYLFAPPTINGSQWGITVNMCPGFVIRRQRVGKPDIPCWGITFWLGILCQFLPYFQGE